MMSHHHLQFRGFFIHDSFDYAVPLLPEAERKQSHDIIICTLFEFLIYLVMK